MTTTELATVPASKALAQAVDLDSIPTEPLNKEEARAITTRITNGSTVIAGLVAEAYVRLAWKVLGYDTWDAYLDGEFNGVPLALPREKRQEVVQSLRASGLSLRAIAAATGTTHQTAANDLAAAQAEAATGDPAPTVKELDSGEAARLNELLEVSAERPLNDQESEELTTLEGIASGGIIDAEIVDEPVKAKEKVQGLDGRSRPATASEPKTPRVATPEYLKTAKKVGKLLQNAQELLSDVYTDKSYIDADKPAKALVDDAMAQGLVDLLEEIDGIKVPAKWLKLVQ